MNSAIISYSQDIEGCLSGTIGVNGLNEDELAKVLETTAPALSALKAQLAQKTLPLFAICDSREDLVQCREIAAMLRSDARDIVVLGTGGSSLGAQALAQLAGHRIPGHRPQYGEPALHFCDNLDPRSFDRMLDRIDLAHTRWLVVSKSGATPETTAQFFAAVAACRDAGLEAILSESFAVITGAGDTPIRRLAGVIGCPILDHHPDIGGRFAVLTNVGLVPALALGLDALAVRTGAREVVDGLASAATAKAYPPAIGAALSYALAVRRRVTSTVLWPYADRLELFAMWYRQLWAESLGKGGKGTTPIRALGPVDQHSQLQLYLDGPKDKLFTLITSDVRGTGAPIDTDAAPGSDLEYLRGRTVGDVVDAFQTATRETLLKAGRPVRVIALRDVDESAMGALFMHFMVETLIAARLFAVNPFDQPAVEGGKKIARKLLLGWPT